MPSSRYVVRLGDGKMQELILDKIQLNYSKITDGPQMTEIHNGDRLSFVVCLEAGQNKDSFS